MFADVVEGQSGEQSNKMEDEWKILSLLPPLPHFPPPLPRPPILPSAPPLLSHSGPLFCKQLQSWPQITHKQVPLSGPQLPASPPLASRSPQHIFPALPALFLGDLVPPRDSLFQTHGLKPARGGPGPARLIYETQESSSLDLLTWMSQL